MNTNAASPSTPLSIQSTDALLIIDMQNDFCPGGALAVPGGRDIVEGIERLAQSFKHVVMTQDWHSGGHRSFASSRGQSPFTLVNDDRAASGQQMLWPDHCVAGSQGAELVKGLEGAYQKAFVVLRKGMNPEIDSYSAFMENDGKTTTGLDGLLRERGVKRVFCVGLAYDYCVGFTAMDAVTKGFEAVVIRDLCRAIAAPVGYGADPGATSETYMDLDLTQRGVAQVTAESVAAPVAAQTEGSKPVTKSVKPR